MRTAALVPLLLTLGCTPDDPDDATPDSFSIVVVPDTQIYAAREPAVLRRHARWIVDHADELDIRFVTHVGDIVNDGESAEQWNAAKRAFGMLQDADIPHGFSPANHDVGTWASWPAGTDQSCMAAPDSLPRLDCEFTNYLEAFGPQHYEGRPWWGGASPSGKSSFQTIDAEGLKLLFLHLPMDPPEPEVAWAEDVLADHRDHAAAITTHRYMYDFRFTKDMPPPLDSFLGGRFNTIIHAMAGAPIYADSADPEALHQRLVAAFPNVWAVHCGHIDAELRQTVFNSAGLPVEEVLVDFQNMADGGGGFLRVLTVTPSEERVEVYTVSTETGEMRENGESFEHHLDVLTDYADVGLGQLENLGFDTEVFEDLLAEVQQEGETRDQYRTSLYADGRRDSAFLLDVPFADYVE